MNLEERINLMIRLGEYISNTQNEELQTVKLKAYQRNKWFTEDFVSLALHNISNNFLEGNKLKEWIHFYHVDDNIESKELGIVMAGNIPLVGFHDFLCAFICGHKMKIKLSEKDDVLLPHLIKKLIEWNNQVEDRVLFAEILKDCDAYIATGSNNSSRYFDYYFKKYPSIIRRNKTSVAILEGGESPEELEHLADDVNLYYGLGCRNVTKIFVPEGYDFLPLLHAFKKYDDFADQTKFRNNYDYNLALLIMNNQYYMTTPSVILVQNDGLFSPVSELFYTFYNDLSTVNELLNESPDIQCITGRNHIPFGQAQSPSLFDYADGVDTMQFLLNL